MAKDMQKRSNLLADMVLAELMQDMGRQEQKLASVPEKVFLNSTAVENVRGSSWRTIRKKVLPIFTIVVCV